MIVATITSRKILFLISIYFATAVALIFYQITEINCEIKVANKRFKRSAIGPIWTSKRIPFEFENIGHFDESARFKIKHALKILQESLSTNGEMCIEFVERTNEKDYVQFVNQGGCHTYVGFRMGKNIISLGPTCINTPTILHEMVHK